MIRLLDCFTVWLDPVPPIEPCLQLLCFGNKMFIESHGGLTQIVTPSPFHNGQPACGEMPLGASYLFPHMPLQPSFHLSPYLVSVLGWRRIALGAWGYACFLLFTTTSSDPAFVVFNSLSLLLSYVDACQGMLLEHGYYCRYMRSARWATWPSLRT